ncbi:MAG TPA: glutathione S-transferase domain-containing protein, partial [Phenylobacterium sp.]|nr:glutathione S-transferase domain-containing protein [Phenylobacterium sp.]
LQVRLIGEAAAIGGYLVGERPTIADWFLLPHLLFFGRTPEGAGLLARAPETAAWLTRMQDRASYAVSPMRQALEAFHHLPEPAGLLWGPE